MRWLDGITNSLNVSLRETLRDGEGQGSLACCSPWDCKELDTTEGMNKTQGWHKSQRLGRTWGSRGARNLYVYVYLKGLSFWSSNSASRS